MRALCIILNFLAFIAMITSAAAQDKAQATQQDYQAMMETYAKLSAPGEPHKLFSTLAGQWTTKTKSWMEPDKPAVESTGTAEFTMLLGGRFLQQNVSGEMMGQPFSGISINGYDNIRKQYVSSWIDSMGTGIFIMEGSASPDGKTITMTGQHDEPGGGKMSHRSIWTIVDGNTQMFDMYGTHHGGKEMKMMEITYTRKQ